MESKPKVLVFIDWFYPGYKAGGPIRSCLNMMNHLIKDFDFYVVCSDKDYLETKPYENIKYGTWNTIDNNIFVRYLDSTEQNKKVYSKIITSDVFEIIYINGIYSRSFSLLPLRVAKRLNKPVLVSVRGMLKESAIAVKKRKKVLFLNFAKLAGLYKNVTFHCTNQEEVVDVKKRISHKALVKLAPNLPKVANAQKKSFPDKTAGHIKLISLARVAPEKNLLYAIETLQQINENIQIQFDIYGAQYDIPYWEKCQAMIKLLPPNVVVKYNGLLHPNEIDSKLAEYHMLFLPTRGENFGHVILESLIAGTPVLISDQTPWRNLESQNVGFDLSLKDKENFADKIRIIGKMNNMIYNPIRESCLDYADKYISNKEAIDLNKNLFLKNE